MNKGFFSIIKFCILPFAIFLFSSNFLISETSNFVVPTSVEKYNSIPEANEEIPFKAFDLAFKAYMKTPLSNNSILTIIDYSKPSNQERFYVLDVKQNKLLYKSHTAHGINTGNKFATKFSNVPQSKQSSLGFFRTGATYSGKHGFSLRLHGVEKGINDKAFDRAIVIHKADYMSKEFIKKHGRAGRSWGCPALPDNVSAEIINTIKNGSGLFIYADDKAYLADSQFVESI